MCTCLRFEILQQHIIIVALSMEIHRNIGLMYFIAYGQKLEIEYFDTNVNLAKHMFTQTSLVSTCQTKYVDHFLCEICKQQSH